MQTIEVFKMFLKLVKEWSSLFETIVLPSVIVVSKLAVLFIITIVVVVVVVVVVVDDDVVACVALQWTMIFAVDS